MKKHPTSTPTARLIVKALTHSPSPGLTYSNLADNTGMCLHVVRKTVRRLEAAGIVRRIHSYGRAYVALPCFTENPTADAIDDVIHVAEILRCAWYRDPCFGNDRWMTAVEISIMSKLPMRRVPAALERMSEGDDRIPKQVEFADGKWMLDIHARTVGLTDEAAR